MPSEIRFNAFGIPYIVEFANVSFKNLSSPKSSKSSKLLPRLPRRAVTLSHCPTCGNHTPELSKARSLDLDRSKAEDSNEQMGGLYIQLPSRKHGVVSGRITPERLSRLRRTIAYAVTRAGMSTPAADEQTNPLDNDASSDGFESRPQTPTSTASHTLFKGTYGQVKTALRDAGLIVTPCSENGYEYATRLGFLFVARAKHGGGIEFQKLTLWG